MKGNIAEQQTVLYEFNDMTNVVFLSENNFPDDHKILTHKLEYFKEFDGETDVIRYSRCNNKNIVSYYTIKNGIAACGVMKDREIDWSYIDEMTNFVKSRFKAFKDQGITFVNDELNNIFNKNPHILTRSR